MTSILFFITTYRLDLKKQGNGGNMRKIHVTRQFFKARGPQGHFFEKTKKPVFRCGLGECVYQISGLYRISYGQKVPYDPTAIRPRDIYTSELQKIRGF